MESPGSDRLGRFASAVWELVERSARWAGNQLMRSRIRTLVVGVVLILIAILFVAHSFWTAPLVIVGIVMIVVAWVGSRLEGRFAIEWSEMGTGFEMHARFKSSNAPTSPTVLTAPEATGDGAGVGAIGHGADAEDDVIEGEAHTMEIPAEELRALVAALEQVAPQVHRAEADETAEADEMSHTTTTSSNGSVTATPQSADEH